jgi:hypothetical protein
LSLQTDESSSARLSKLGWLYEEKLKACSAGVGARAFWRESLLFCDFRGLGCWLGLAVSVSNFVKVGFGLAKKPRDLPISTGAYPL